MSKTTFGLATLAGALAGSICTVAYMADRLVSGASAPPIVPAPAAFAPAASSPPQQQQGNKLVDPAGWFQYGYPGAISDVARRQGLISGYDRRTRNPAWAVEHITPESVAAKGGDRKHSQFLEDESVPEKFRAKLKDYFRSGYDRGHQVPAADCKYSQQAMDDTFYLTNMCPQVGDGFNRDYWAHFEDFCRRLTQSYPSVRIITGPLYLPRQHPDGKWRVSYEVIGNPPNIAVPTHFYKIVVAEDGKTGGQVAVGAFVLPNAVISNKTPLTEFVVPVEMVERASGLEFLNQLPAARMKELCKEVACDITVREFNNSRKNAGK